MAANPPSRTPRQRLSEDERRRQIVQASIHEVADRGYESATLTGIATRAGVAKGLIWHYFTGKDDLMQFTAQQTMQAMSDRIIATLDLDQPVPDIIRATLRQAAAQIRSHRNELVALGQIVRNLQRPGETDQVTADFYEETYRGQQALFERGQREGSLGAFDTRVMAVTYQGSIDTMLAYLGESPAVDPQRYAEALAEILLGGMLARD